MTALANALKELSADSELESEVVLRPRLEPFVELDLQKDNRTCEGTNEDARAQAHHGERGHREDARYLDDRDPGAPASRSIRSPRSP